MINMTTIALPPTTPNGFSQYPDTVNANAIEVAFEALDGHVNGMKKPDKGLVALRDMLWSAMLHSGHYGGTATSKQTFYDHVAHIACHTELQWQCTMTRPLINAFQVKAENGIVSAKRILEIFNEACRSNPNLKVDG
jgi:hypothetical protein